MSELVKQQETELSGEVGHAEPTAWYPPDNMSQEEWQRVGNTFQQIEASIKWWLGDWLVFGEKKYGETYTQAVHYTGRKVEDLQAFRWVANSIAPERRRDSLSWTAHRYVAKLPPDEQEYWLARAAAEHWNTDDLWAALNPPKPGQTSGKLTKTATPEQAAAWLTSRFDAGWLRCVAELLLMD